MTLEISKRYQMLVRVHFYWLPAVPSSFLGGVLRRHSMSAFNQCLNLCLTLVAYHRQVAIIPHREAHLESRSVVHGYPLLSLIVAAKNERNVRVVFK